uniref:Mu transposase C-terminal domain-containing protein n=1 Tax=Pseudomonas sp. TaxID=306 RepID=UPI002623064B
ALHLLPGTTRSSVADKRDYDPERHAALTLRQLERWIALEIVGKYHNKVHSTISRSPLAMWNESTTSIRWKLPVDRTSFLIDFLPFEERILQKTGVQLFGFEYVSPQLRGHRGIKKAKLRVKYDPRDISRVWVEVGPGNFAEARWRQLGMPPMSKWERERSLKMMSARGRMDHDVTAIAEAVLEQRAIEDESVAQSRRARLKKHRREHLPSDKTAEHTSTGMTDRVAHETSETLVDGPLPYFDTEFFHGGRR